jgi:2-aminoethylphosphonate-pyruvate transaminase
MDRDNILLTPGPLTTSLRTKLAMLKDWGSWDTDFNALTARVCSGLLDIIHGHDSHVVVPLQGSGTFSVEAAIATVVPRDGHLLVLDNGAYCKRMGRIATLMGRRATIASRAEDAPIAADDVERLLLADPSITHIGLIHCETGTGVVNPLAEIAAVCQRHGRGLIVDAISSFAALPIDAREIRFDALVAASGKCLEGVPGMGFVFIRKSLIDDCAGRSHSLAMDLHDQYSYMERTGQWRFTPPTHVVAALAEAMAQYVEEGGQAARLARYRDNLATLVDGMAALGFKTFLKTEHLSPIIVTFLAPTDARYDFKAFYASAKAQGFMLYPGKLTEVETFRVGCIGAIGRKEMQQAVDAVAHTLSQMGITPATDTSDTLGAVVFDWAGTILDFGSCAPMGAFVRLFAQFGIDLEIAEARGPMGRAKWDHIQAIGKLPRIAAQWQARHGRPFSDADVDQLYEVFTPMNAAVVPDYADFIPGALDAVAALRQRGLKIGSTTGYNRPIMEVVSRIAAAGGYVPDNLVCAGDLAAGRPSPLMMYRCFADLGVWPPHRVVKVDDTGVGLDEGRHAGTWTVGVAVSGNAVGLSLAEWQALDADRQETLRQAARAQLRAAGAHYVIDSVADLLPVIDAIEARLQRGERP